MSHNTGWGQHPGQPMPQWGGGWMPPAAPQPGVIPLQPLGTGEILSGAFAAFRRYWKPLVGIMLAVQGVGLLLVLAAIGISVAAAQSRFTAVFDLAPGEEPDGSDVAALFLAFVPAGVLLLITMTASAAMISALCPAVIQEAVLGRPTTFGAMWRRSWSRLPAALGSVLLTGLIAGGPMILLYAILFPLIIMSADGSGPPAALFLLFPGLLVCVPLSVWLMTRFSLAPAAVVCEGLGAVAALRRSSQLVKDGWWRVFGITMLAYVVAAAVGYVIQMPFGFVGMIALLPNLADANESSPDVGAIILGFVVYAVCLLVGGMIGALFQYGFPQLVIALLYVDQRMRKEDLAATLIASIAPTYPPAPASAAAPGPAPGQAPVQAQAPDQV
ncbi:oxidoreductase [Streptomyces sp. ISL-43]|uniref:oxidoreductase n=1 Tax=Streptomyces sp. ISL-43 TaxID=2819183 RepID=UPI001BEA50B0|nr:oxidoreductase [Streptomyces sp. ISL-43]MBT2450779.1 oxidoreductase [Streptomyces sp. ISL-43]